MMLRTPQQQDPASPAAPSVEAGSPPTPIAGPSNSIPDDALPVDVGGATGGSGGIRGALQGMLEQNPYFSAGFGLMGVGVALTALRRSAILAGTFAQRRMLVSLEINSKDKAYLWFLNWMSHQAAHQRRGLLSAAGKGKGVMGMVGPESHELALETTYQQRNDGGSDVSFSLVPGPGTHYFRYKRAWFQVKRERTGSMVDLTTGKPFETVKLLTLSRDRSLLPSLLAEARELAHAAVQGRTVIYTAWGSNWQPFGQPRQRRSLDSVVLERGQKERIVNDVKEFMGRGKWYADRGIPYRRGYLLYGPPGSGKSSFIMALVGELEYNICALNLSDRGLTDDKLNHLLANVPERSVVLLEDVDAAFVGRTAGEMRSNVTFSGLLNAIDGVASSTEQRILIMTTNHLDRLDPALIRPGRVDLLEKFDDASPSQAGELFAKFYRGHPQLGTDELLDGMRKVVQETVQMARAEGKTASMAGLQGLFIRSGPGEAVRGLDEVLQSSESRAKRSERFVTSSAPT